MNTIIKIGMTMLYLRWRMAYYLIIGVAVLIVVVAVKDLCTYLLTLTNISLL